MATTMDSPCYTRHNAAHVDGHELAKKSIDWEDTPDLGDIAVPNPPLLQHSSSLQSYLQVMSL